MGTIITGILTGGFSFLGDWWKGKQENAKQELNIKQETAKVKNQILLQQVTGQLDIDSERVKMMSKSWRDEWFTFLFSIPLLNMFISPFVDLIMLAEYKEGMLAQAASEALTNLDNAPLWYIIVVLIMFCLSFGYEKGIDKILNVMNVKK